jgi:hypothetical protein
LWPCASAQTKKNENQNKKIRLRNLAGHSVENGWLFFSVSKLFGGYRLFFFSEFFFVVGLDQG